MLAVRMINMLPTLLIVIFGWFLSGVIHELGHLIVGKIAGLKVDSIQPWAIFGGLHVRFSGKTTNLWYAAISISGPLLPVLVGVTGVLAIILLKDKWPYIRYAVWVFWPMMVQSLMLLCVPLAAAFGIKASNDDVTKFIELAEWPPLAVSLIGLLLAGLCVVVLKWAF